MIHEMYDNMHFPNDAILTFDDGLYTQYRYSRDFDNEKIFFITTQFICEDESKQSTEYISSTVAHLKARDGNYENFMTLNQIRDLKERGYHIGGHSHLHVPLHTFPTLREKVEHIVKDTTLMLEWFDKNLGIRPTKFCFPYNDDCDQIYTGLLKSRFGFTEFYGKERATPDETLV